MISVEFTPGRRPLTSLFPRPIVRSFAFWRTRFDCLTEFLVTHIYCLVVESLSFQEWFRRMFITLPSVTISCLTVRVQRHFNSRRFIDRTRFLLLWSTSNNQDYRTCCASPFVFSRCLVSCVMYFSLQWFPLSTFDMIPLKSRLC